MGDFAKCRMMELSNVVDVRMLTVESFGRGDNFFGEMTSFSKR
jgi:hypothetical protein